MRNPSSVASFRQKKRCGKEREASMISGLFDDRIFGVVLGALLVGILIFSEMPY